MGFTNCNNGSHSHSGEDQDDATENLAGSLVEFNRGRASDLYRDWCDLSDDLWRRHLFGASPTLLEFENAKELHSRYWEARKRVFQLESAFNLLLSGTYEEVSGDFGEDQTPSERLEQVLLQVDAPPKIYKFYNATNWDGSGRALRHVLHSADGHAYWIGREHEHLDDERPFPGYEGEHEIYLDEQRWLLDGGASLVGFGALVSTVVFMIEHQAKQRKWVGYKWDRKSGELEYYFTNHPDLKMIPRSLIKRVALLARVRNCFAHQAGFQPKDNDRKAWESLNPGQKADTGEHLLFNRASVDIALEIAGRLCYYLDQLETSSATK